MNGVQKMTVQEKALALINRCEIGMLGNKDEQGNPQIKAMLKAMSDGLSTFWFCSNTSSKRVAQIKKDGNSCLYFYDGFEGVMLRGVAEVTYDDDARKSLWEDGMELFYPLGPTDPDYALIKFISKRGNYYKNLQNEDFDID